MSWALYGTVRKEVARASLRASIFSVGVAAAINLHLTQIDVRQDCLEPSTRTV